MYNVYGESLKPEHIQEAILEYTNYYLELQKLAEEQANNNVDHRFKVVIDTVNGE